MEELVKQGIGIAIGKLIANYGVEYVVNQIIKPDTEEKKLLANLIIKGLVVFFAPKYLPEYGESIALGFIVDMVEDIIAFLIKRYGRGE